jgi:hypothetical protein
VFVGEYFSTAEGVTRACFYNTVTKELASPIYYVPLESKGVFYAPEFDVMVSVHDDDDFGSGPVFTTRVWSFEVGPAVLSAVQLIAGVAKAGQLCTYRVQVLGDQSDICVGELVNWTLTGVGLLLDAQSETDDEGYATTRVLYGVTDEGDSTIEANVTC